MDPELGLTISKMAEVIMKERSRDKNEGLSDEACSSEIKAN